jgi:hypothetical protein
VKRVKDLPLTASRSIQSIVSFFRKRYDTMAPPLLQQEDDMPSHPSLRVSFLKVLASLPFLFLASLVYFKLHGFSEAVFEKSSLRSSETSKISLPSCTWSPNQTFADSECRFVLEEAIYGTADVATVVGQGANNVAATTNTKKSTEVPRRWLFFGDSTMFRLFARSSLKSYFVDQVVNKKNSCRRQCDSYHHGRCGLAHAFLSNLTVERRLPNFSQGEGPIKYGFNNADCHDCLGCDSTFAICHEEEETASCQMDATESKKHAHGGYIAVEFARDVELQTPSYATTQENLASFLQENFNSLWQLEQFGGRPICVISAGFHDIAIPNITLTIFLENVIWYLELLSPQCSKIIWLQNTSPEKHNDMDNSSNFQYPQTVERIRIWNQGVYQAVSNSTRLQTRQNDLVFMDPFEASCSHPHADNIHMKPGWYRELGSFFTQLAQLGLSR